MRAIVCVTVSDWAGRTTPEQEKLRQALPFVSLMLDHPGETVGGATAQATLRKLAEGDRVVVADVHLTCDVLDRVCVSGGIREAEDFWLQKGYGEQARMMADVTRQARQRLRDDVIPILATLCRIAEEG